MDINTYKTQKLSAKECGLGYRESIFKKPKGKNLVVLRIALHLQKEGRPNLEYKDLKEYFKNKPQPSLQEIRNAVLEIRSKKFPNTAKIGNAGSFFKNPVVSEKKFLELKKKYPELPGFLVNSSAKHILQKSSGRSLRSLQTFENVFCSTPNYYKLSLAWILDKICNLKGFSHGSATLWENQPLVLANVGGASAKEIKKFAEEIAKCVYSKIGIKLEWEVRSVS